MVWKPTWLDMKKVEHRFSYLPYVSFMMTFIAYFM